MDSPFPKNQRLTSLLQRLTNNIPFLESNHGLRKPDIRRYGIQISFTNSHGTRRRNLRNLTPLPSGQTSKARLVVKNISHPSARDHLWELKPANPHAYSEAGSPQTKSIIFSGVWLDFGPSAIFTISLVFNKITDHLKRRTLLQVRHLHAHGPNPPSLLWHSHFSGSLVSHQSDAFVSHHAHHSLFPIPDFAISQFRICLEFQNLHFRVCSFPCRKHKHPSSPSATSLSGKAAAFPLLNSPTPHGAP